MKYFNKKYIRYLYFSLLRQSGSPEAIAKSAAIGLFSAFFIPIGFQIPVVLLLAFIFRAKKILSIIFTLPTNVYTVIFIYPVQCWLGAWLCGIDLNISTLKKLFGSVTADFSFGQFLELGKDVVLAFFVGGFVFGVISAVIGYYTIYGMIISHRERIKRQLIQKMISRHEERS